MSGIRKGLAKVEIALRWDPSPAGSPPHDLDLVAGAYPAADPYGEPAYLVHFGSRSPDGTITLNRDSQTGQGLGYDEVMTLELDRLSDALGRVVVGVVIQDTAGAVTFGQVAAAGLRIRSGYTDLVEGGFTAVAEATAAVVAEFVRGPSGDWSLDAEPAGFTVAPAEFTRLMGAARG
ncbi:TerD family protein [Streptomyces sp. NPDC089919]|uniref:TerD family protein n=1 Tax=Streptomyces sp. NPDC089919 TaxID=3155188 RepID=UPI003419CDC5